MRKELRRGETLGQVLKQRRRALGFTQRELADVLGVKAGHITHLENGRRRPSLSLLGRLAEVLGLDKEPLFLLAHPEPPEPIEAHRKPARRNGDNKPR
jgi:transcriptional regulator with XRE-family HTH domain